MTKNQENPILGIRLGAVNKKRWENYCARNGKTQSTAIREAVEKAMDVQEPPKPVRLYKQVETVWKKEKKVRFPIRLTRSEKDAIEQRAEQEKCSQVVWIVDAIRTQLTREPQLRMDEILALGQSNYQLLRVGNNLNQIAKQMNKSDVNDIRIETIQSVEKMIKEHVNIASDLIRAATERWELK